MSISQKNQFVFKTVPTIYVENNSVLTLARQLKQLNVSRPLIVTDAGIVQLGLMIPALDALSLAGTQVEIYSDVVADPPDSNVLEALELALNFACDGVVGFGGGSSMDVAKLVAVLLKQQQSLQELYGVDQIHSGRVPLIQIPTTAGTGSEATGVAIVTTGESTKSGVVSDYLLADVILLDPILTIGLPPRVTAATGIDAMVHAVESYTSKRLKNPLSDLFAINALALMSRSIRVAVKDGSNVDARSDMLLGAMMAGQAFSNAPVAAVHALAYPLGGIYHIPHGLSNSLVLPHVLRFNGALSKERSSQRSDEGSVNALYAKILVAINLDITNKSDLSNEEGTLCAADVLADYFLNLSHDLGLPTKLRELDIKSEDLAKLAKDAILQQRLLVNNPREVSYKDALQIYQNAY